MTAKTLETAKGSKLKGTNIAKNNLRIQHAVSQLHSVQRKTREMT